jgi:hypothetical protein
MYGRNGILLCQPLLILIKGVILPLGFDLGFDFEVTSKACSIRSFLLAFGSNVLPAIPI